MKPRLDLIGFQTLDPASHFYRLSNQEYLNLLHRTLWDNLAADQQTLLEKLLSRDRTRYIAVDDPETLLNETHAERYGNYKARLTQFGCLCVDALCDSYGFPLERLKLVVTNTSVQGICPPLSSVVMNHLQLPSSVRAIDLCFMGCAAALRGIELCAASLQPGDYGLVLSTELTSAMTNLRAGAPSLPASCVFGDGVSAMLVAARPHRSRALFRIRDLNGSLVCSDDGLGCIHYEPADVFHEIHLQDSIPEVAARGIQLALEPLIRRSLITVPQKLRYLASRRIPRWQDNVDYFLLHAGGTRILEGVKEQLALTDVQVEHNFAAFRRYGNTSSTSILYSLQELLTTRSVSPGDRLLFLAYGSGFMTQAMYVTAV